MSDSVQNVKEKEVAQKEPEQKKLTAGEILKGKRKEEGIPLEIVHEATKIPMDALKAIEEGYTVRTLTSFYRKGFVKIYAKYLDVNICDVIDDYKREQLPKHVKQEVVDIDIKSKLSSIMTRKRKKQAVLVLAGIFSFFVLFKIITFFTHRKPAGGSSSKVVSSGDASNIIPEKKVIPPPVKKVEVKAPPIETKKKIEKKQVSRDVPIKTSTPETKTVPAAAKASSRQVVKDVTLTVRAKKKGWLTVKADGVIVFRSSIALGAVETWIADKSIEISGNNINQLELELNGKMIGPLGRKDRKAKRVVVTRDGLTVSK